MNQQESTFYHELKVTYFNLSS